MATVNYTLVPQQTLTLNIVKWLTLTTTNSDGQAFGGADFQDRTVQITGTLGAGGSISIQGSNDGGTTWAVLTDPLGNALTFTSLTNAMKQITELPALIRPLVNAGDGTTSLNVFLHMRGRDQ